MDDQKLWTAADMETLTPNERAELLNKRVVTDLSTLPPEVLARIRSTAASLLAKRDVPSSAAELV